MYVCPSCPYVAEQTLTLQQLHHTLVCILKCTAHFTLDVIFMVMSESDVAVVLPIYGHIGLVYGYLSQSEGSAYRPAIPLASFNIVNK